MLRASLRLLGPLQETFSKMQGVWNLDFAGTPTTTRLDFCEERPPSRPMFYVTELDAAAGLEMRDVAYLQYREMGFILYRGYTIRELVAQCMGNVENELKGRQMPMHFGSVRLNTHMPSSPIATQIPHAAGAGYALRLENEELCDDNKSRISVVFFGDGAASEGDFHAGVNFAATLGSNTLFVSRNNGYAISTPTRSQYKSDGVVGRGLSYGIPATRVDGHDVLAVHEAVRRGRELILKTNQPVLIEAITYRSSHHSSSDDSSMYRDREELTTLSALSPIARLEKFLVKRDLWSQEKTEALEKSVRQELLQELRRQEALPKWPVESMHEDVYKTMTPELVRAQEELSAHYQRNKALYAK
uniref:2-oxoisovalerate dehydrogenase subunit alpha n=1 Tax=Trypanosoma vivax (strain Y486) TaxID=1055687 RepID=G0U561_TRYVY|nr:putative 2-oxoisovalerate dehydrogenase [Trypanosoma vivax Y486]